MDFGNISDINVVYSRFSLHAINDDEERIVLNKVKNLLPNGGIFAIEVRSTKDPLCGVGKKFGQGNCFIITNSIYRKDFIWFPGTEISLTKTLLGRNFKELRIILPGRKNQLIRIF